MAPQNRGPGETGNKQSQSHVALFTASGQFPHHAARRGDPERASDPQCGGQRADVKRAKEGRAGLCPDTPSSAEGCPRGFDWSSACAYGRERQQKIGEKYWNTVGRAPPTVHTCREIVSVPTGQSDFLLHGRKPLLYRYLGLLGGLSGKDPACQCRRVNRCRFDPWIRKIPWRRKWHLTPIFLPRKFYGQRSLAGSSPRDRREPNKPEQLSIHTHNI